MYNLPPIFIVFFLDLGLKKKQTLKVVKCCVYFYQAPRNHMAGNDIRVHKRDIRVQKRFISVQKRVIEWSKMVIECSKKGYKYLKKEPTPLGILEEGLVSLVG